MNNLRRFCLVLTLTLTFAFSAYAGNIECPAVTDEPSQPTESGNIECPALDVAVSVIQSALSLS